MQQKNLQPQTAQQQKPQQQNPEQTAAMRLASATANGRALSKSALGSLWPKPTP